MGRIAEHAKQGRKAVINSIAGQESEEDCFM